jgi:hypothetical protein
MSTVILRAEGIKDHYDLSYRLDIEDRDGADMGIEPIEVGMQGVEIDHRGGSEDDPHSRIITSTLTVTIFIEDNEQHEWFKSQIVLSDENRYVVKLYILPGPVLQFVGNLVTDQVIWEDMSYPYELQISAVDGLARLKDIEYKPKEFLNLDYRLPMLEHIIDILAFLKLEDVFGSDAALQVAAYWYEDRMKNQTDCPIEMIDFSYRPFAQEKGLNKYDYMSCWEALEQMALLLNARFYHANGMFVFEQINYRTEDINTNWFYQYDGTLLGSLPVSNEGEVNGSLQDLVKERGGTFSMIPPIRTIRLRYRFKADANYLHNNLDTWSYLFAEEKLVGLIDEDDEEGIRFLLGGKVRWEFYANPFPLDPLMIVNWKIRYKITLKVGDKWLKRVRANNTFEAPIWEPVEWSDTFAQYFWETPIYYADFGQFIGIDDLVLLTIPLEDYGEVRFNFEFDRILIPDSLGINEVDFSPVDYEFRWWLEYPTLYTTLEDGSTFIPVERTYTYEGPVENSRRREVILYLGDGPNTTNLGRIRVLGSDGWKESSGKWTPKGQDLEVTIQKLIVMEMAALLVKPLVLMNANIIHRNGFGITPFRVLNYLENRYLFMNGKLSTTPADFNGSWFLMNYEPLEE